MIKDEKNHPPPKKNKEKRNLTTENIQTGPYCQIYAFWKKEEKKERKNEQPYNFTVDKAQPSYHWCHIWLLLLLFILLWTVSSVPILSCSSELWTEKHTRRSKRQQYSPEGSKKNKIIKIKKNLCKWSKKHSTFKQDNQEKRGTRMN